MEVSLKVHQQPRESTNPDADEVDEASQNKSLVQPHVNVSDVERKPLVRNRNLFITIIVVFVINILVISVNLVLLKKAENKLQQNGAMFPQTCSDFLSDDGISESGVYTIYPYGNGDLTRLRVYCDMETDGGGWMVFQKRIDGSEDFYRNFKDYVKGFGRLEGEFWLGLDVLHKLTKNGKYEMRVDMEDFEGETRYALYNDFIVGIGKNFTMTFGGYSGTAGQALYSARFSAKDRDQDIWPDSCSNEFKGGWWYAACHDANPNGLYLGGAHDSFADGIEWKPWHGYYYSLKRIDMKLKKK